MELEKAEEDKKNAAYGAREGGGRQEERAENRLRQEERASRRKQLEEGRAGEEAS